LLGNVHGVLDDNNNILSESGCPGCDFLIVYKHPDLRIKNHLHTIKEIRSVTSPDHQQKS
ncbi:MAG: hypothetical protein PT118_25995, partial [Aphanizomenon gracile PMC644.10]|nr:hypothetical protein [Aphanizomenon gracile PMC644.10]